MLEALRDAIANGDDEWEARVLASYHRLRLAQDPLLARVHATAVGTDQSLVEIAEIGEIFGRQAAAMCLNGRHFTPDLVEMDRRPGVEPVLQGAQFLEQLGRAHVGGPGGNGDTHPTIRGVVVAREGLLDLPEVPLAHRAVELIRCRITDLRAGAVPGAYAEQPPQSGVGQRLGVVWSGGTVLEDECRAAA